MSNRLSMALSAESVNGWMSSLAAKKEDTKVNVFFDGSRYFAKAVTNIKKGETMFSMPLGTCIDSTKVAANFASLKKNMRTGDFGLLALQLLSERAAGPSSPYYTYIQSLPIKAPGILSWSENELAELGKSTTRNIQKQVDAVRADWDNVISKVKSSLISGEVTFDDFKWAMGIVKSRAVFLDDKPTLVPGMDYIQFDPLSTAEPVTDSAGFFGGKIAKVVAERSYEAGEEVVMSYGLKSSAECLEDHGIVPDIPLEDSCCEITVSIDGTERFPEDKVDILERNGYG
jgi:[ribulose-bisphosphate carboxylase]/[fructose-bisphosphate aldolase]-lysine N-methyltransferase